jgi:hypothetical protein
MRLRPEFGHFAGVICCGVGFALNLAFLIGCKRETSDETLARQTFQEQRKVLEEIASRWYSRKPPDPLVFDATGVTVGNGDSQWWKDAARQLQIVAISNSGVKAPLDLQYLSIYLRDSGPGHGFIWVPEGRDFAFGRLLAESREPPYSPGRQKLPRLYAKLSYLEGRWFYFHAESTDDTVKKLVDQAHGHPHKDEER